MLTSSQHLDLAGVDLHFLRGVNIEDIGKSEGPEHKQVYLIELIIAPERLFLSQVASLITPHRERGKMLGRADRSPRLHPAWT